MTGIPLPSPFAAGVFMLGMLNGMNHLFQQFLKHTIASSLNWPGPLMFISGYYMYMQQKSWGLEYT